MEEATGFVPGMAMETLARELNINSSALRTMMRDGLISPEKAFSYENSPRIVRDNEVEYLRIANRIATAAGIGIVLVVRTLRAAYREGVREIPR